MSENLSVEQMRAALESMNDTDQAAWAVSNAVKPGEAVGVLDDVRGEFGVERHPVLGAEGSLLCSVQSGGR